MEKDIPCKQKLKGNIMAILALNKIDFKSEKFKRPKNDIKVKSEVSQSYPTLCDPVDCSLPGSSVHGIL